MSTPERWRLADLDDIILDDEGGVALKGAELIWLSPLAAHLVCHLGRGITDPTMLAGEVLGRFGPPPPPQTAPEAVTSMLRALSRRGVVRTE